VKFKILSQFKDKILNKEKNYSHCKNSKISSHKPKLYHPLQFYLRDRLIKLENHSKWLQRKLECRASMHQFCLKHLMRNTLIIKSHIHRLSQIINQKYHFRQGNLM